MGREFQNCIVRRYLIPLFQRWFPRRKIGMSGRVQTQPESKLDTTRATNEMHITDIILELFGRQRLTIKMMKVISAKHPEVEIS